MRPILLLCLLVLGLHTAEPPAIPDGGTPLVASGLPALVKPEGWSSVAGSITRVAAVDVPFQEAVRIRVTPAAKHPWEVQLTTRTTAPLAKGDACLLELWLRAVDAPGDDGEVTVTAVVQKASPDWKAVFHHPLNAGKAWRRFLVPFTPDQDFAAGEAQFALHCAQQTQGLEAGGLRLLTWGTTRKLTDLPRTRTTYAGMEADAPWRAEAEHRIEQIRKGDLTVRVVDANGHAVAGAAVQAHQVRHAFAWGSCVVAGRIMGTTADDEQYRKHITGLFNRVVTENDLKWGAWAGEWGTNFRREQTLAALGWLTEQRIQIRGHCLVWPAWRNLPKQAKALKNDVPALRKLILDHIDDLAAATGKLCQEWDVQNEPFDNHDLMDLAGDEVMVEWFARARQQFPTSCRLFINDYDNVESGNPDAAHSAHFQKIIRYLLDHGAPVEGLGLQSHFGRPVAPTAMLRVLDRYAAFKLPLEVTEYDFNSDDEQLQADFTRDYMTIIFSHPAMTGFLMWGFWEKAHWLPKGAMFRADWSEKPNAAVYRDLVFKRWWTDATGVTGSDGTWTLGGFKGDYRITVGTATTTAVIGEEAGMVVVGR